MSELNQQTAVKSMIAREAPISHTVDHVSKKRQDAAVSNPDRFTWTEAATHCTPTFNCPARNQVAISFGFASLFHDSTPYLLTLSMSMPRLRHKCSIPRSISHPPAGMRLAILTLDIIPP